MGANSLHLNVLDGFAVRVGRDSVTIRGARSSQVLAYLAINSGSTVSIDRLSDALWGGHPPASPRNSIQRFVSDLRRDLGSARLRVVSIGNGYRLDVGPDDWCDAVALEKGLPRARAALADGRPGDALATFEGVTRLVTDPLASFEGAAFVTSERVRLGELLADRGELVAMARLARGDDAGACAAARQLLDQHPYRERLCTTLATALARLGRANEALRVIGAYRSRLRDDLGLEPSPDVARVELDVLLHRDAMPVVPPTPRSSTSRSYAGDADATRLHGRSALVREAAELLETQHVVTLTGTGGIGKTAVARAVTELWRQRHEGDVRFVSFEEVTSQGLVSSVGHVVGTSSNAGVDPLGDVVDRICADVDLLVLDNCEHIAGEVGSFVDEIVERRSQINILVTSRRPLSRPSERVLLLGPLDNDSSRRLLAEELARAGVEMSDLDPDSILELLNELDGLPLAIELAGASLRSVGVRDLLTRWRSDEPRSDSRRDRHLSIANAVGSTLDQLDEGDRELLSLCAIFPADFDAAALEALACASVIDPLRGLRDHSLLEVDRSHVSVRYRMLVPVRSEIRARSGPLADRDRDAFVAHFAAIAAHSLVKMKGIESLEGVRDLRGELHNIAVAFNFADDGDDVAAMAAIVESVGLANGMSPSVGATSHLQEWGERLRNRAATLELADPMRSTVQQAVAWGLYGSNDGAWYRRWETESQNGDVATSAMAAVARFSRGQSAEAWDLLSGAHLASIEDPYMRAMLCGVGAVIAFEVGADVGASLADAAACAADERPSHGASFFAGLARSAHELVEGDASIAIGILESTAEEIDGHGLITLENMGLASVAMTAGLILVEHDPADLLIGIVDRYLEQHNLDPASVAMALDVTVLRLDRAGFTDDAANLLGLLDRLGLSMAILRGARSVVESKIDGSAAWSKARAAGSTKTTFDVLRSTRTALLRCLR